MLDKDHEDAEIMETYKRITGLEKSVDEHHETIEMIQDAIIHEISLHLEKEDEIFQTFNPRIEYVIIRILTPTKSNF